MGAGLVSALRLIFGPVLDSTLWYEYWLQAQSLISLYNTGWKT